MWTRTRFFHGAFAALLTGCVGTITDGPPDGWDATSRAPGAGQGFTCNGAGDPGPAPLKRLTPTQYASTIRTLFGDGVDPSNAFPQTASRAHLGLVQPDVSQFEVETYQNAAATTASAVAERAEEFAPCEDSSEPTLARECLRSFLSQFGPRIYRSPLSTSDIERLLEVFDVGQAGQGQAGYAQGLRLVLEAMLNAPRFLYRPEFGIDTEAAGPGDSVPLSGYELASRLSFAFWDSGPDAQLIEQAASGALDTEAGLAAELARVLRDGRADGSFRAFFYAWLSLGDLEAVVKDAELFPAWQGDTAAQLREQTDAFVDALSSSEGDSLDALFSLEHQPLAPAALASWYSGPAAAAARGVLTLPALLAVHSKPRESFPIYRGLFVREKLLCQPLPSPPPDIAEPPEPAPGVSTRERFEQHSSVPACQGCHELIDPLGFAFENYDAIGHYRAEEEDKPIDPTGHLVGTDVDGEFGGLGELSMLLAESELVRSCAAQQWFRYVMQRFEQSADGCSMRSLIDDFAASGYDFQSLRTAIVNTRAFKERRAIAPQESPP